MSTISFRREAGLGALLDDEGANVIAGLIVVLVVRAVAVGELGALPAATEDTLERMLRFRLEKIPTMS